MTTIQTMLHKRILFLISLPRTPEFEKDREDVEECLNELRELQVDVCECISREVLAKSCDYDIVIVVAHRDNENDALVLSDGTMMMSDFVSSLPTDFKGIIDLSSCYSATSYQAIKNRCPQCRVQASLVEVSLLQRIIMYPSLVQYLNEETEIDYHEAFIEVSKAFEEFAKSKAKDTDEPIMTQLGQQMSSIYSPSEVKRETPFQIIIFFHYNSEKKVVKMLAQRWQTNAIIRDDFEIPIEMKEGDEIAIKLYFDSTDNANIVENDNEYTKNLKIKKEMVTERFKVTVRSDFKGNGFLANIEMLKDDISFLRCAFNINVVDHMNQSPAEVIAEIHKYPENPKEITERYHEVFTSRLFGEDNSNKFNSIYTKNEEDEEKVFSLRKLVFTKNLFLVELDVFLKKIEEDLSEVLSDDKKGTMITLGYVPILKNAISKHQKKLNDLQHKMSHINPKDSHVNFEDAIVKFRPLELEFVDLCHEIKNLDYQIDMLGIFQKIAVELKKEKINIVNIKELVTEFLEHAHKDSVDKGLFDYFKNNSGTGSVIHPKSKGATMPFLALVLAMVLNEYVSEDHGKEDWSINVEKYIDFSKYTNSLRTPKNRINKLVSLLDRKEIREMIKNYQKTEAGKISVTAYYLLKVKVKII